MRRKRGIKWFGILLATGLLLGRQFIIVQAGIEENPYVTLSPDGNAYTVQAGEKTGEWYEYGTVVDTGVKATLRDLQRGEHLYDCEATGRIPIGKWFVSQKYGRCIHREYPEEETFHGVSFGRKICKELYFSGWLPLCANCNEVVEVCFFYMSDEAATSMKYIDATKAYYYKCPHCDNLEQGREQVAHICKNISKNRYYVRYDANEGNGYMAKSVHMYDNAEIYEGREVTPQTTLSLNTYHRRGYVFVGWNMLPDGSGEFYEDGAQIFNLTEAEGAEVTLYAQWRKCQSVLQIDLAGGLFQGEKQIVERKGMYGEQYEIPEEEITPPMGYKVTFDTLGGSNVAQIQGTRHLVEWRKEMPFCGELNGSTYTFSNQENIVDKVIAVYAEDAVILPAAEKAGYSFGGWYLDPERNKRVGAAGDEFIPGSDTILYAGWVELQLEAMDNYVSNGGKGAVDLCWTQKDTADKLYTVYQRREGEEWKQLIDKQGDTFVYETTMEFTYSGEEQIYSVPYTGMYKLSLYGAQGENYGAHQGGYGGGVEARVFLEQGDKVSFIIGGQKGFGGGGNAEEYGNGGGATVVKSAKLGELLIAGGGGGASEYTDGMPGGSAGGLHEAKEGESGACGGGGGYRGGQAGKVLLHIHEESCVHEHLGNPAELGGCYNIPVLCGETEFERKEIKRVFYYGNIEEVNGEWVHVFCVRCGSHDCPGHLDIFYGYTCQSCGKVFDKKIEACEEVLFYERDCRVTFLCGYKDNEIISLSAAYGGSNYINTEYCFNPQEYIGLQEGNGKLCISTEMVYLSGETQLNGVVANDYAPPIKIAEDTVILTGVREDEIRVSFEKPQDAGTTYYHKVESLDRKTHQGLCTSNETENLLISGVVGYYYIVDYSVNTKVDKQENYLADSSKNPFLLVEMEQDVQYLHIAPVDKAGNLGETLHLKLTRSNIYNWPLLTEKISIQESSNVKASLQEEAYYIKADGVTPFRLECMGYVYGNAGPQYQITHMSVIYSSQLSDRENIFSVITPMQEVLGEGVKTYSMQELYKKAEGEELLLDGGYTITKRYNYGKNLLWLQEFILPSEIDGQRLQLIPQVAVLGEQGFIYSDELRDRLNGVCIIADGKGPKIDGVEQLEEIQYMDLAAGENMRISLSAQDEGSGLAKFYVEIKNADNGILRLYEDTLLTGQVVFEVTGEDLAFAGEFQIMVVAEDAVGNRTVEGSNLLGVGLQAYVERMLEPHNAGFKRGESGILHIRTMGYVERVEILLPEMLVQEGEPGEIVYVYTLPEYMQTEKLEFVIPLKAPEGVSTIQVKAYKAGTELERKPQYLTIEVKGSILDELRTRLR